jgi:hypothetical protein
MKFEKMRKAIEEEVRKGLGVGNGDWNVVLEDGTEIEFRPRTNGEIVVEVETADGDCVWKKFLVRVEEIHGTTDEIDEDDEE